MVLNAKRIERKESEFLNPSIYSNEPFSTEMKWTPQKYSNTVLEYNVNDTHTKPTSEQCAIVIFMLIHKIYKRFPAEAGKLYCNCYDYFN